MLFRLSHVFFIFVFSVSQLFTRTINYGKTYSPGIPFNTIFIIRREYKPEVKRRKSFPIRFSIKFVLLLQDYLELVEYVDIIMCELDKIEKLDNNSNIYIYTSTIERKMKIS